MPMSDPQDIDAKFNAQVARSLQREALRRAAHDVNKSFGPGLESVLEQISVESTAEAAERASRVADGQASISGPIPVTFPLPTLKSRTTDTK
jgi:hypothetical protein